MNEEQLKNIIVMFGLDGQVEWEDAGENMIRVHDVKNVTSFLITIEQY